MQKTVTLADLMRRMGVPFDINPFVSMYLNDMLRSRAQPAPFAAGPQGAPFGAMMPRGLPFLGQQPPMKPPQQAGGGMPPMGLPFLNWRR